MVTRSAVPLLVAGMLLTGISNSLLNKWQDMQCVGNCDATDPKQRIEFSQPVWQTLQMFLGECLCLLPVLARLAYSRYHASRDAALKKPLLLHYPPDSGIVVQGDNDSPTSRLNADSSAASYDATRSYVHSGATHAPAEPATVAVPPPEIAARALQPGEADESAIHDDLVPADHAGEDLSGRAIFLFFMPAFCDICGTTLMNVGLLFTPVSIYQMTRGALVLWVGVFSVIFLRRHLFLFQWLSLVTVMLGVCVVGMSGTLFSSSEPKVESEDELPEAAQTLLGVLLILFAQLFTASQFVLEERIMSRYAVEPLLAVGYEGIFGTLTTLVAMPFLHYFIGRTPEGRGGYFDMAAGWHQIIHVPAVFYSSIAIAFSIAFFNFFGLSVTRTVSATARSTIDTCRTLGIWIVSLVLGWEVFRPLSGGLQVVGFGLLVYGTFLFNGIVSPPAACVTHPRGYEPAPVDDADEVDGAPSRR
ncbi:uncharacterized protein PFL1_00497 [Pseudozyma flocculosa PF-1]|uniref:Related to nucleotide-sugar transporter n=1 Tax=Pseudozyma flocculosa TaxID=84751 RepID=A0A5C3EQZ8_9BASI|nr:uncharacterized protein PFL1_00497 [Pseudozyma flocculosa PF-1]EPQ32301.1 hypothetical protein PFL1_00497 [Pseudozyma flocculosa PF-1]SPO34743.1 related to nucleotide-sugar transporter [Pseudozyma flocculosa]